MKIVLSAIMVASVVGFGAEDNGAEDNGLRRTAGNCKSYCANDVWYAGTKPVDWEFKCGTNHCDGCDECVSLPGLDEPCDFYGETLRCASGLNCVNVGVWGMSLAGGRNSGFYCLDLSQDDCGTDTGSSAAAPGAWDPWCVGGKTYANECAAMASEQISGIGEEDGYYYGEDHYADGYIMGDAMCEPYSGKSAVADVGEMGVDVHWDYAPYFCQEACAANADCRVWSFSATATATATLEGEGQCKGFCASSVWNNGAKPVDWEFKCGSAHCNGCDECSQGLCRMSSSSSLASPYEATADWTYYFA